MHTYTPFSLNLEKGVFLNKSYLLCWRKQMSYFYMFLSAVIAINTLISVITVFSDRNRDIAAIWAWLLVLNIFPVVGLIIYLFLGRKISKEDIYNLREQSKVNLHKYLEIKNNIKIDQIEYINKKDFK